MKNKFSKHWKSSKQPKKQRKYLVNAPLHIRKKFLNINLSKELRKKYRRKNISGRKGDVVKIIRGKFKNKKGKIVAVKMKMSKVEIDGMLVKKQDGSKVNIKFQPSNLQIVELYLEDRKRNKILGRIKEEKEPLKENHKNKVDEDILHTKEEGK